MSKMLNIRKELMGWVVRLARDGTGKSIPSIFVFPTAAYANRSSRQSDCAGKAIAHRKAMVAELANRE